MTRRLVTFQPGQNPQWSGYIPDGHVLYGSNNVPAAKPPYQPGDILYVRETFVQVAAHIYWYKADSPVQNILWRPSIHMPKEAARIFLRVTDVFPEPLKSIRYFDCLAEGIPYRQMENDIIRDFAELWDSTIKPADRATYSFEANPWVWVNKFERISRNEAGCDA